MNKWLLGGGLVTAMIAVTVAPAHAAIDLTLSPVSSVVDVGEVVEIEVYVTSDSSQDQLLSAVQMIFFWQTPHLGLLGNDQTGSVDLLFSGFPANDPYGINESVPPQDGLGLYQALAPLGAPVGATPAGTLLTTLQFMALEPASGTPIDIVPSAGDPLGHTIVFDGTTPNTDVTGVLTGTSITIIPLPGCALLLAGLFIGGSRTRYDA